MQGGKDAASPRYIFTKMNFLTPLIFPRVDEALLTYKTDDGEPIEPEYYVPILPMLLINGSEGIGTGWSTSIPSHNPQDVIDNLLLKLDGKEPTPMIPWTRGFTGETIPDGKNFITKGMFNWDGPRHLEITELPVGKWVEDYKTFLVKLVQKGLITKFSEFHSDTKVHFKLNISKTSSSINTESSHEKLMLLLKLQGKINTTNMHAFDQFGKIKKYQSAVEILDDFYPVRLHYYLKRKEHLEKVLSSQLLKLKNRLRFLQEVDTGALIVTSRKISKETLVNTLRSHGYDPARVFDTRRSNDDDTVDQSEITTVNDYDYLLNTSLMSFTTERAISLQKDHDGKEAEYIDIASKSAEELWRIDLQALQGGLLKKK